MKISAKEAAVSTRWVGGLNPFAIYDVAIHKFTGSGKIGVMFRDSEAENRISVTLVAEDGDRVRYD